MNRKEKIALCEFIASMEWSQDPSSAAAAVKAEVAHDLRHLMKIDDNDADLGFFRLWEIANHCLEESEGDRFDVWMDRLEELELLHNYDWIVSAIEDCGSFKAFYEKYSKAEA
ncbi:MAG: hypothetical protein WC284_06305 [Candidimonas sp.]